MTEYDYDYDPECDPAVVGFCSTCDEPIVDTEDYVSNAYGIFHAGCYREN